MKNYKKYFMVSLLVFAIMIISIYSSQEAYSNGSGAPAGRTGSPGDAANCTGCHGGSPTSAFNILSSNIPVNGYKAGNTYTITATITSPGITKYGFQVSPQKPNGTKVGTIVITNATETQLIGSGKYITHKTAGTAAPSGTKTWTFNWTAPVAGTGSFSFYGAFVAADGMNNFTGDKVTLTSLSIVEDTSTGIEEKVKETDFKIYPNPSSDQIKISSEIVKIAQLKIYDQNGKVIQQIDEYDFLQYQAIDISDFSKGIYFVNIKSTFGEVNKKIIKN